jgi:2'-5' RNA ligase
MEERLPFLAVSLPQWFRDRYKLAVANLELNARSRLTTPYDLHFTLKDLLSPANNLRDEHVKKRQLKLQTAKTKVYVSNTTSALLYLSQN